MNTPPTDIIIRAYRSSDAAATLEIFIRAILGTARAQYSEEQTHAWLGDEPRATTWDAERLAAGTLIAERDGVVLGFTDLSGDGYIDRLFTLPAAARQGVAAALLADVIRLARERSLTRLTTHASRVARPVFERAEFVVDDVERVQRGEAELERYAMHRELG
ncbi:GNAT family N-acetyltransferase [Leifsonia sp. NPDC014704]|uniref:GNAT family N-acetyltransferase n=1 Tax=Leifsonia sp. NPDC014704 TaxID=3364123 RepID=UPI0036F4ACD5